jgi:8-oxo-dGTP pyrophosphatase MutT (NUDIX family)
MARTSRASPRGLRPMIGNRVRRAARAGSETAYADAVRLPIPVRRAAYRGAYAGLRVYWFVRRPEVRGVKCVLTQGDLVLLARHTYGDRHWDLPGGRMRRDEPPFSAARREMNEELGLLIEDWKPIGVVSGTAQFRRDRMQIFHAEMRDGEIEIDRGELATTRWFPRHEPPENVASYVPQILRRGPW